MYIKVLNCVLSSLETLEQQHDKTNIITYAPRLDVDQLVQQHSLIGDFVVCINNVGPLLPIEHTAKTDQTA